VAACGGVVPMMSGRGLGHTGGTLDKLESIPGFRTNLSLSEMREALGAIGCVMIGQTAQIAPADRQLYALRDVTGTIESIPLISASIMSKKIAAGVGALVLDVKQGRGAFMKTPAMARALAESLVAIGKAAGVDTRALITSMDRPIGRAVGNANEVIECIELLKGRSRPDLLENALELSERMLTLARVAKNRTEAAAMCQRALATGAALERFRAMIERQGGNPRVIDDYALMPQAPAEYILKADSPGFVTDLDAELIGRASVVLGGGRDKVDDDIDPAVGLTISAPVGDAVQAGAAILRIQYREAARLQLALPLLTAAVRVGGHPEPIRPLILDEVG
jgi:pyrimidine-nucleoside phosphorylase